MNTIIINGERALLGRLASYAAKQSLQGKSIIIVNSDKVIITGNKKDIVKNYRERKLQTGSNQKGRKYSYTFEKLVKRTIRGMLPQYREGRGREAYKKIRCYGGIPEAYKEKEMISMEKEPQTKFFGIKEIVKSI
jgi:large subunit ribosomal protein L13